VIFIPAKLPSPDVFSVFGYKVSHKSEYTPHISANIYSRNNIIEMKLEYILELSMRCL